MIKNNQKIGDKDRKIGQIMGINIISTSIDEVLTRVKKNLSHNVQFYIVTPNPELVLMAQSNPELKSALNASELPVPDGVGLNYASKYLTGKGINIIPGRKLFMELIEMGNKDGWSVFFLGGENGEANEARIKLCPKYQNLRIESMGGPNLDKKGLPVSEVDRKLQKDVIDKINKFKPDLLFVAFGNPKQEVWIHSNIGKLNVGGAMAVGGTFRYVSGMSKLPPGWMEKAGLEWLFRLTSEPARLGRIINASIVFPWRVFISKIVQETT